MLYAIVTSDIPNSADLRKAHSIDHLARLTELKNLGRLIIAGPLTRSDSTDTHLAGVEGSLIVAEFSSLNEAQEWANQDPFFLKGIYENVRISPFKKILP